MTTPTVTTVSLPDWCELRAQTEIDRRIESKTNEGKLELNF